MNLTHDQLLTTLEYDPLTGWFYNRTNRGHVKVGEVAGWWDGSSWKIRLHGTTYLGHRLAWFYMKGYWPVEIDHKDGDRSNNVFENLRDATSSQNSCNANYSVASSGSRGVYPNHRGGLPWRAVIQIGGRQIWLGTFATIKEAAAVYREAAEYHHGEFAFHNRPKPLERRI